MVGEPVVGLHITFYFIILNKIKYNQIFKKIVITSALRGCLEIK